MRESQRLFQKLVPEEPGSQPIFGGARLRKQSRSFVSVEGRDCLVNIYSAELDEKSCRFGLIHSPIPRPPRHFLDGLGDAVIVNAGFMYTVDGSPIWPENFTYHLQIADGSVTGLPTKTKYAIVSHEGRLRPELVEARGSLRVGGTEIRWIGSHEPDADAAEADGQAACFGPANQGLIKNERGIFPDLRHPVIEAAKDQKLVCFTLDRGLTAKVAEIADDWIPHLTGTFVLRMPTRLADRLKPGDAVTDWRIGSLTPENAEGAVTVGVMLTPSVKELEARCAADRLAVTMREDGETPYYGASDSQKGRTCLARTKDGLLHFLIVDARPKIPGQQGMTLRELADFLYAEYGIDWAISLDGGQSSKICWNSGEMSGICGNLHYINLKGIERRWDGMNGRPVTSCIVAKPIK